MRLAISACLWFWGVVFSFAGDIASFYHWDKTGFAFSGAAVVIFGGLAWFHFKGYKRAKVD